MKKFATMLFVLMLLICTEAAAKNVTVTGRGITAT